MSGHFTVGPPFLDWSWLKLTTTGDLYRYLHTEGLDCPLVQVHCSVWVSHTLLSSHRLPSVPPASSVCLVNSFWSFKISFKHYSTVHGFIYALLLHRTYHNYNSSVYFISVSLIRLSLVHCSSSAQTLINSKCPINICWMNKWIKYWIELDSLQGFFWLWHISCRNFYWLVWILRNVM